MNTNNLKISIKEFRAWRAAQSWRATVKTRAAMLANCGKGFTISNDHKKIYFHEVADYGPVVWDSAKDARGTTGYYADNFQDAVIQWATVKIAPANKKHGRDALFAPVTYCTGWEGVTLHLDEAGEADDARRWGERIAEREANQAREEDAKFQAENQIDDARSAIHAGNKATLALLAELRHAALPPAICGAVRERLQEYLAERKAQFATITKLERNYWDAVCRSQSITKVAR